MLREYNLRTHEVPSGIGYTLTVEGVEEPLCKETGIHDVVHALAEDLMENKPDLANVTFSPDSNMPEGIKTRKLIDSVVGLYNNLNPEPVETGK